MARGPRAGSADLHPAGRTRLPEAAGADHALTGDPVDLYLRLWSRSGTEPADELERWWRDTVSVTW